MEDKANRRSRPRPYDLRRKVLLKNFLKEQMTYIPQIPMPSSYLSTDDDDFSTDLSNMSEKNNLSDVNDENVSSSESSGGYRQVDNNGEDAPILLVKKDCNQTPTTSGNTNDNSVKESKLFKFSSILNIRKDRKKKRMTGIVKAKKSHKTVKSPAKFRAMRASFERFMSNRSRASEDKPSDSSTKSSSKSLFFKFKAQRELKKAKKTAFSPQDDVNSNDHASKEILTSDQSIQTDNSWAQKEFAKVEQSNKLLKEENRLLYDSLSYFMSSNSLDSHLNSCGLPLKSSNRNMSNIKKYPGYSDNLPSCSSYEYSNNEWSSRARVMRSKSMYERRTSDMHTRYPYRTKSMRIYDHHSEFSNGSASASTSFSQQTSNNHIRKKNILKNLSVNNTGRVVHRRSSMPERILSENERSRMCRRSGSLRGARTPFHSLPAEAFY